jgi:amidase
MWNVAGYPALSIPFGTDQLIKTPIGIQIAAPPGSEPLLMALAQRLEQWKPWPRTAPGWQ